MKPVEQLSKKNEEKVEIRAKPAFVFFLRTSHPQRKDLC